MQHIFISVLNFEGEGDNGKTEFINKKGLIVDRDEDALSYQKGKALFVYMTQIIADIHYSL